MNEGLKCTGNECFPPEAAIQTVAKRLYPERTFHRVHSRFWQCPCTPQIQPNGPALSAASPRPTHELSRLRAFRVYRYCELCSGFAFPTILRFDESHCGFCALMHVEIVPPAGHLPVEKMFFDHSTLKFKVLLNTFVGGTKTKQFVKTNRN